MWLTLYIFLKLGMDWWICQWMIYISCNSSEIAISTCSSALLYQHGCSVKMWQLLKLYFASFMSALRRTQKQSWLTFANDNMPLPLSLLHIALLFTVVVDCCLKFIVYLPTNMKTFHPPATNPTRCFSDVICRQHGSKLPFISSYMSWWDEIMFSVIMLQFCFALKEFNQSWLLSNISGFFSRRAEASINNVIN